MIWSPFTVVMADPEVVTDNAGSALVRTEAVPDRENNPLSLLADDALSVGGRAQSVGRFTVTYEDGRFRLWYPVRGVREALGRAQEPLPGYRPATEFNKSTYTAYAESDDGVYFRPVRTGGVEIDGSRDNNLLDLPDGGAERVRQTAFFHDPLDHEWPYKCLYYRPMRGEELEQGVVARFPEVRHRWFWGIWGIGRSRDGIEWLPPRHDHLLVAANPELARLHRALDGGLVISDQMSSPVADLKGRNVKGWITYDHEHAHRIPGWLFAIPDAISLANREQMGAAWDHTRWVQPHLGVVCARKGPSMIGIHGYLYGAPGALRPEPAETFAQYAEAGLSVSATGVAFRDLWPLQPFVRRGRAGEWDHGMVGQCALVDTETETLIYYLGGAGNLASSYAPGIARIGRDRYAFRLIAGGRDTEPRDRQATFSLLPLTMPLHPAVTVNVSHLGEGRTVRLGLADEHCTPIAGFGVDDCLPITTDSLTAAVRWQGDSQRLAGATVRITVRLDSAGCGPVESDSPRIYALDLGAN